MNDALSIHYERLGQEEETLSRGLADGEKTLVDASGI